MLGLIIGRLDGKMMGNLGVSLRLLLEANSEPNSSETSLMGLVYVLLMCICTLEVEYCREGGGRKGQGHETCYIHVC